jgi:hypothetical protein
MDASFGKREKEMSQKRNKTEQNITKKKHIPMVASCYQIWKETKRILQFKNLRQHRSYLGIPIRPVA